MAPTTDPQLVPRPPSPWPGSQLQTRHRWQLDGAASLSDVAADVRELAKELVAAHAAGWWLVEPMRGGHLLAARASRRQRAQPKPRPTAAAPSPPTRTPGWRLRLVDDLPSSDDALLDTDAAPGTPVVAYVDGLLTQVGGPALSPAVIRELARQTSPADLDTRRWAVAPARAVPGFDLVAEGGALRGHAVQDGVLVRTVEALTFQHAADGAASLQEAAAAYERLAGLVDAVAAAGGRLASADDGFLHVSYDLRATR